MPIFQIVCLVIVFLSCVAIGGLLASYNKKVIEVILGMFCGSVLGAFVFLLLITL